MGPHKNFSTCAGMLTDMHGLVQVLCMSRKVHEYKNPVTSRRNNFAVFFPAWSSFLRIVSSLTKTLSLGLILVTFFRDYSATVVSSVWLIQVQGLRNISECQLQQCEVNLSSTIHCSKSSLIISFLITIICHYVAHNLPKMPFQTLLPWSSLFTAIPNSSSWVSDALIWPPWYTNIHSCI